jgi:ATP phosphoribosyltransferase regulatory subunit
LRGRCPAGEGGSPGDVNDAPDQPPRLLRRPLAEFAARKTERVDTPVIQPAEPFLDMAGEDLRRRIFMTESETGASLCLRPEFTIPVCLRHIETAMGTPKRYSYLGEVFRQRREGGNEFYQAGIEDLGDINISSADARAVSDATGTLQRCCPASACRHARRPGGVRGRRPGARPAARLAEAADPRLRRYHDHLEALLASLVSPQFVTGLDDDVARLLGADDDAALIAHIDNTMQATGYSTNASRSPQEIARRLKEKLILSETRSMTPPSWCCRSSCRSTCR